jgi:hydrogenase maturation protein HypF
MLPLAGTPRAARSIHVRGIVQGVGFRPHVFRLAHAHGLAGWVLNGAAGVQIHVEGSEDALDAFVGALRASPPVASHVTEIDVTPDYVAGLNGFEIRRSEAGGPPSTRIAPDLAICDACLRELFDPTDRRYRYPYINCTECGPRYSIVRGLPYDRPLTTMAPFPMCPSCAAEYADPTNRRFHAQPVACPRCGPGYRLVNTAATPVDEEDAIAAAVRRLRDGQIVAIKGIGGYHLSCDAANRSAVAALRDRKYRKEQAFAVMVRDAAVADETVSLTPGARTLLESPARPIVLAPARMPLPGVAPDNQDLGVVLPYAPLHHLLFAAGAPDRLVMTSGNVSSEPIEYTDDGALRRLHGLADAFLVGGRPIARRMDDSVVREGPLGPMVVRRSRGLAPAAVATLAAAAPILAVGGDLKNAITLVAGGQAYVSQHVGDLSHAPSRRAFEETIADLLAMYAVAPEDLTVVCDRHPEYASTAYAAGLAAARTVTVQHHRAHVASVLAERDALEDRVLGVAFDGTGYGDDGAIWGGEFLVGSVHAGFARVAHLRQTVLVGGDAAARHPVQAAAGFLADIDAAVDFTHPPFCFPPRYEQARTMLRSGIRVFPTTSAGRLFDTAAALLGFNRPITFEGQATMWLEHLARAAADDRLAFTCCFTRDEIDWRELLADVIRARQRARPEAVIARAFHRGLARAIATACVELAEAANVGAIVLSGGVMQNQLLLEDIREALPKSLALWTNRAVPPNDGGLSLGQAALALFAAQG